MIAGILSECVPGKLDYHTLLATNMSRLGVLRHVVHVYEVARTALLRAIRWAK